MSSAQYPSVPALRISPVAQRIVDIENVDITILGGSGISGRIIKADILAALAHPVTPSPRHLADDTYVLTAIDVDMGRVLDAIAHLGPIYVRRRLELSYSACVALAVVAALPDHPLLNSWWCDDAIIMRRRIHLLAVPRAGSRAILIRDAQDLNLRGLARGLSDASAAAANTSDDSSFTIADLGDQLWVDPAALARGRSAALGIGAVRARPLVLDDGGVERLAVRRVALLTLAYDARTLDQCHADAFLRDLKRRLEHFDP
jgi:pyruvate dehydrogenase E2 component (dihydrolipoamide acetyltransferase)